MKYMSFFDNSTISRYILYMFMIYLHVIDFVQIPDCSLWVIHQWWIETVS